MKRLDALGRRFELGLVGEVHTGRLVWVDAVNGNDATGRAGRLELPFQTLAKARDAAVAVLQAIGAPVTIMVLPGNYTGSDSVDLLRNGVNWHFLPGTYIAVGAVGSSYHAIFDDGGSACVCSITGHGKFDRSGSNPDPSWILKTSASGSIVSFECDEATGEAHGFCCAAGVQFVHVRNQCIFTTGRSVAKCEGGTQTLHVSQTEHYAQGDIVCNGASAKQRVVADSWEGYSWIKCSAGTQWIEIAHVKNCYVLVEGGVQHYSVDLTEGPEAAYAIEIEGGTQRLLGGVVIASDVLYECVYGSAIRVHSGALLVMKNASILNDNGPEYIIDAYGTGGVVRSFGTLVMSSSPGLDPALTDQTGPRQTQIYAF